MKKLLLGLFLFGAIGFSASDMGTLVTPSIGEDINSVRNTDHTFVYTTTGVSTNVIFNIQGTIDGSNYFDVFASDTTVTSDTTGYLNKTNFPVRAVRVNWISKSGVGTTPNLSVKYEGN